jgi:hypothetical protein
LTTGLHYGIYVSTMKDHKGAIIAWGLIAVLVFIFSFSSSSSNLPKPIVATPAVAEKTYAIPAEIQPIIGQLGISAENASRLEVVISPDSSPCQKISNSTAPGGCFIAPSTIIYPTYLLKEPQDFQNAAFAHEYLHYVWSRLPSDEKASLAAPINQAHIANASYLDGRLANYTLTDELRLDELHSYIGTELSDDKIPQPLLDHYKKYLPNRDALPSYY